MVRMPNVRRPVILGVGLALVLLIGTGSVVARQAATASEPLAGAGLTAADVRILVAAAESCPVLTPARLAGQVMVASHFGDRPVGEMRRDGAVGVAALTPEQWREYAPSPDADPQNRRDAIRALAHATCQSVGQSRPLAIDDDPWRIALATYRVGIDQVIAAGGVPDGASGYVDTVERYAAWYALQPALGGAPASPAPTSAYLAGGDVVAVPEVYVDMILDAGDRCPELPPAKVAGQIMATSGFDPHRHGPAGEQGIAQFLPEIWAGYVNAARGRTPWKPASAIPALGHAMCQLIEESGGQYGSALAAFTRGDSRTDTPLLEAVTEAEAVYDQDPRLAPPAPATEETPAPDPSTPDPEETEDAPEDEPTEEPAPPRDNQPPVMAADSEGPPGEQGPYFIHNYRTDMCIDLPGTGAGDRDGPVNQGPCAKTGTDNQEWILVPRAVDDDGYILYWIRNTTNGYCIDPPGRESVPSGTQLNVTGCFDQDNQHFRLEPQFTADGIQYYRLLNSASGLCIDVPGQGTGGRDARLNLVPCLLNDDHDWALIERGEW